MRLKESSCIVILFPSYSPLQSPTLFNELHRNATSPQPDAKLRPALRAWPQFGVGCG
jgi:hypothetical protein